jgi:phage terminase small subunit
MMVSMVNGKNALTDRQRRFVHAYATNGQNGTAAAREAGYKGTDNVLGVTAYDLLRTPKIESALRALT